MRVACVHGPRQAFFLVQAVDQGPCPPSSPRGSTARESCGIHSGPESVLSPACAPATLSTVPGSRNDASFVPGPGHSTHAVRSPDIALFQILHYRWRREGFRIFSQHVLQHRFIQRQFGHQLLQLCVLITQSLQLTYLIYFHPGVFVFHR
jgi:hypothetical protein